MTLGSSSSSQVAIVSLLPSSGNGELNAVFTEGKVSLLSVVLLTLQALQMSVSELLQDLGG